MIDDSEINVFVAKLLDMSELMSDDEYLTQSDTLIEDVKKFAEMFQQLDEYLKSKNILQ